MGFGSYDESEQGKQDVNAGDDDGEALDIRGPDYDGEVTDETDADTDALLDQLTEIKAADEDDE